MSKRAEKLKSVLLTLQRLRKLRAIMRRVPPERISMNYIGTEDCGCAISHMEGLTGNLNYEDFFGLTEKQVNRLFAVDCDYPKPLGAEGKREFEKRITELIDAKQAQLARIEG